MLFALDNVTVLESELENVKGLFDAVTFRAFRNFSEYRRDLFAILPDNGFLFAYKGKMSEIEPEMAEAGIGKYRAEKISVPFMAEERHIVITVKGGNQ